MEQQRGLGIPPPHSTQLQHAAHRLSAFPAAPDQAQQLCMQQQLTAEGSSWVRMVAGGRRSQEAANTCQDTSACMASAALRLKAHCSYGMAHKWTAASALKRHMLPPRCAHPCCAQTPAPLYPARSKGWLCEWLRARQRGKPGTPAGLCQQQPAAKVGGRASKADGA